MQSPTAPALLLGRSFSTFESVCRRFCDGLVGQRSGVASNAMYYTNLQMNHFEIYVSHRAAMICSAWPHFVASGFGMAAVRIQMIASQVCCYHLVLVTRYLLIADSGVGIDFGSVIGVPVIVSGNWHFFVMILQLETGRPGKYCAFSARAQHIFHGICACMAG